ncbi:hypothetical protein [Bacillus bombysepticus]|uniref:hypothetical protein n=1 Tax=Bacillus bombysepticus TaxID=658666 RepID=UPI003015E174
MNPYNGSNLNYQNNEVNVIKRSSTKITNSSQRITKSSSSDGKKAKKLVKTASMCVVIASGFAIGVAKFQPIDQAKSYLTEKAPEAQKTVKDIPVVGGVLEKGIEKVIDVDKKAIPSTAQTTKAIEGAVPLLKDTPQEKQEEKNEDKKKDKKKESSVKEGDIPEVTLPKGGIIMNQNPPITPAESKDKIKSITDYQNVQASEPKGDLVKYDANTSIAGTDIVSAETIDQVFGAIEGSQLQGYGKIIREAALQKGLEPGFVAMIYYHESDKGRSPALKKYNNPAGIMCMSRVQGAYKGCQGNDPTNKNGTAFMSYNYIEEALFHVPQILKTNYLDHDQKTIGQIGAEYAPVDAKNQVGNENQSWIPSVVDFMNKMMDIESKVRAEKASGAQSK